MNTRILIRNGSLLALSLIAPVLVSAQGPPVVTTGLRAPTKLVLSEDGYLIVSESGAMTPNMGGISRVSRCGQNLRLVDGLPSGLEPRLAPSGPNGIEISGRTIYVAIGAGDGTIAGTVPGTELPNPNPSSPILSSVLSIEFGLEIDELRSGFLLKREDHDTLLSGSAVTLVNAEGATATVKLLVDFPDYTNDPFLIARASNPFALALVGQRLFLADASQNTIFRIALPEGTATIVATLPRLSNPSPIGPPVVDPVPDGIRFFEGRLLITLLTGFPFAAGNARVLSMDPETGSFVTGLAGLSSAIDVAPVRTRNGGEEYYTLEFSTGQLANAPGRVQLFRGLGGTPELIAGGIITTTGMVRDPKSGDIFVTEYFPGRILQIQGAGEDGFDTSIEDDDSGDVLRFNRLTGEYLFVSCRLGTQLSGVARVVRNGCVTRLRGSRIEAQLEGCSGFSRIRGQAQVWLTTAGPVVTLQDSNTADNKNTGKN